VYPIAPSVSDMSIHTGTSGRVTAGLALAGLATATGLAGAASPAAAVDTHGRGEVVTVQPLRTLSTKDDVVASLTSDHFKADAARYGVDTYQVVYRTIDAYGKPTIASGLLALPRNGARKLRTVSYTHGTEINRNYAPSLWSDVWAVAPAITYASAGFAAVAPDYLGQGLGPGLHPYMDVPSEATAAVDLLRAARTFAPTTGRELQPQVYVTGFSQGATAAMGLARALQGGTDRWFRLAALAPIAGVYDGRNVEVPALAGGQMSPPWDVVYTAYLLVAWNRTHPFYRQPDEVFAAKYADTVEGLFDGVHQALDVVGGLPADIGDLLTAHGFDLLRNPSGGFAEALRVHDSTCTDWTPRTPVRLNISGSDEQALYANSAHCLAALRSHGVAAQIVDVGSLEYNDTWHLGANILGTASTVEWFSRLR
jgi:dienelactone hydrolase